MKAGKTTTKEMMVKLNARLTLNFRIIVVAAVAGCLLVAPSTRTHKQKIANQGMDHPAGHASNLKENWPKLYPLQP